MSSFEPPALLGYLEEERGDKLSTQIAQPSTSCTDTDPEQTNCTPYLTVKTY